MYNDIFMVCSTILQKMLYIKENKMTYERYNYDDKK